MGCTSGKTVKPTLLSKNGATAQNTLLSSAGKEGPMKEAVKPAQVGIDGAWSGGVIKGKIVTWTDGSVSSIRTDRSASLLAQEVLDSVGNSNYNAQGFSLVGLIEVSYEGGILRGELLSDDLIHWSDGEAWTRQQICSSFQEYMGYIAHEPDLLVQTMTLEEAKSKAASMPTCQGFTHEGVPNSESESMKVHFKSVWNNTGGRLGWRCHRSEEVGCAVGDQVMAIFGPTGRRYAAEVQFISVDLEELGRRMADLSAASCQLQDYSRMVLETSQITLAWKDGGKTHRVVAASHVFKDGVTCIMETASSKDDLNRDGPAPLLTIHEDDLQSGGPVLLPLPAACPQSPGHAVDADAIALMEPSNAHQEERPQCSTRLQTASLPGEPSQLLQRLSGGSPSTALKMEASPEVGGTMITVTAPARKEKSLCCC